jgi:hypothetical protein
VTCSRLPGPEFILSFKRPRRGLCDVHFIKLIIVNSTTGVCTVFTAGSFSSKIHVIIRWRRYKNRCFENLPLVLKLQEEATHHPSPITLFLK